MNPIKIGIDEQEQNGVTVPKRAAMQFAMMPWNRHDLSASLRWKVTLNIRYQKDQHRKQHKNFYDIIQEKVKKFSWKPSLSQSGFNKKFSDQIFQPVHSKNLVLKEIPSVFYDFHSLSLHIEI